MMKTRYTVHSIGPAEKTVETTMPDGVKAVATVKALAIELVPDGPDSGAGTVKLISWSGCPFEVGDTVEGTFEKVGAE